MDIGIIGLPQSGKTTVFNALTRGQVESSGASGSATETHLGVVKETDRLAAMASELRKVGAEVVEGRDYLEITPPSRILPAAIDTYNDHRMAMCFSLAALGDAAITINNPGCVSKTFPDYFQKFGTITHS